MKLMITPIDKDAEENGIWTKYRDVDLLIARSSNTKFKSAFRRVTEPYGDDLTEMPEEKSAELLSEALAEGVLLDWKNFIMGEEEIPYSKINAKNLLVNDVDCRNFITDFSGELENYIVEDRKKLVGE